MNLSFNGKGESSVEFSLLLLVFLQSLQILNPLTLESAVFKEKKTRNVIILLGKYPM